MVALNQQSSWPSSCYILKSMQTQPNLTATREETVNSFPFIPMKPFPRNKIRKSPKTIAKPTWLHVLPEDPSLYTFQVLQPHVFTQIMPMLDLHENSLHTTTKIHLLSPGSEYCGAYNIQDTLECLIICCSSLSFSNFV